MVVNLYTYPGWEKDPDCVYIGRPGRGQDGFFGSKIVLGALCPVCKRVHTDRGSTLPCFEAWARKRLETDPVYRERVKGLHGKTLVCFCKPRACHGDVLERLARELNP